MPLETTDARRTGESHEKWRSRLAREYILAYPAATIEQVRQATRVSKRTISRVRQELIKSGQLAPSQYGPQPKELPPPPHAGSEGLDVIGAAALAALENVANARILTRDERQKLYSNFATHRDAPYAARIAALGKLDDLDKEQETKRGLPEPQDRTGRVTRVALMCEALLDFDGIEALNEAYQRAVIAAGVVPATPPPLISTSHASDEALAGENPDGKRADDQCDTERTDETAPSEGTDAPHAR